MCATAHDSFCVCVRCVFIVYSYISVLAPHPEGSPYGEPSARAVGDEGTALTHTTHTESRALALSTWAVGEAAWCVYCLRLHRVHVFIVYAYPHLPISARAAPPHCPHRAAPPEVLNTPPLHLAPHPEGFPYGEPSPPGSWWWALTHSVCVCVLSSRE